MGNQNALRAGTDRLTKSMKWDTGISACLAEQLSGAIAMH